MWLCYVLANNVVHFLSDFLVLLVLMKNKSTQCSAGWWFNTNKKGRKFD